MIILSAIDAAVLRMLSLVTKSEKTRESLHQFIKFALIGVVNTVIDFSIYYILTRYTQAFDVATYRKYIANVISFFVATTFSFYSNRIWTFEQKNKATFSEAARFYSTTSTGIVLNSLLLFLLINIFTMNDLLAKFFATFVTIFWNYLLKRFWVFNTKTS
jgi:putative flippase GtrA